MQVSITCRPACIEYPCLTCCDTLFTMKTAQVIELKKSLASAVTANRTDDMKRILLRLRQELTATEEIIRVSCHGCIWKTAAQVLVCCNFMYRIQRLVSPLASSGQTQTRRSRNWQRTLSRRSSLWGTALRCLTLTPCRGIVEERCWTCAQRVTGREISYS